MCVCLAGASREVHHNMFVVYTMYTTLIRWPLELVPGLLGVCFVVCIVSLLKLISCARMRRPMELVPGNVRSCLYVHIYKLVLATGTCSWLVKLPVLAACACSWNVGLMFTSLRRAIGAMYFAACPWNVGLMFTSLRRATGS